jgi:3-oxoisoapionate kinase
MISLDGPVFYWNLSKTGEGVYLCDTSSRVGRALGIERLDFVASIDPGAPPCRAMRGMKPQTFEVAFKGGQMGRPDYLIRALGGC